MSVPSCRPLGVFTAWARPGECGEEGREGGVSAELQAIGRIHHMGQTR